MRSSRKNARTFMLHDHENRALSSLARRLRCSRSWLLGQLILRALEDPVPIVKGGSIRAA